MWREGDTIYFYKLKADEPWKDDTKYNVQVSEHWDSYDLFTSKDFDHFNTLIISPDFDSKKSEILEKLNTDNDYGWNGHIYTNIEIEKIYPNKTAKVKLTSKYKTEHTIQEILNDLIKFDENTDSTVLDSEIVIISVSN